MKKIRLKRITCLSLSVLIASSSLNVGYTESLAINEKEEIAKIEGVNLVENANESNESVNEEKNNETIVEKKIEEKDIDVLEGTFKYHEIENKKMDLLNEDVGVEVSTVDELLVEIDKFNVGNEDEKIIINNNLEFKEEDLKENTDGFIKITNLENDLIIEGRDKITFSIKAISDQKKGAVRFISYGDYKNILNYEENHNGNFKISNIDFDGNKLVGGISNYEGRILIENSNFYNGYILNNEDYKYFKGGGAIFNARKVEVISTENIIFNGNKSDSNGGAIYNTSGQLENLSDNIFNDRKKNIDYYTPEVSIKTDKNISFLENESDSNGGAIWSDGDVYVDAKNIEFKQNQSDLNGGAIYFSVESLPLENEQTEKKREIIFDLLAKDMITFKENCSDMGDGGAIFSGKSDNDYLKEEFRKKINILFSIKSDEIEFSENISYGDGGAIFNNGYVAVEGEKKEEGIKPIIVSKTKSDFKIEGTNIFFKSNETLSPREGGGAIYNGFKMLNNSGERSIEFPRENYNFDIIANENINFMENKSENFGGAIYNNSHNGINMVVGNKIEFNKNNSLNSGAAITNKGYESVGYFLVNIEAKEAIFTENKMDSEGGAIFNAGEIKLNVLEDISFNKNSGGAIKNSIIIQEVLASEIPKIKIINGGNIIFSENSTWNNGGAINNAGYIDIETKSDILFERNFAGEKGGAINNEYDDVNEAFKIKPVTIKIKSLEGNINFVENGKLINEDGDINLTYEGGAINNAGNIDVISDKDIFFSKNIVTYNGAVLNNSNETPENKENITNIISEKGSVYFISNELGEEKTKEEIEEQEEVNETDVGIIKLGGEDSGTNLRLNINSKNDIYFFDNISNTGSLIAINTMIYSEYGSPDGYYKEPEELINLEMNFDVGKIYLIGNKTYDNTPIIVNQIDDIMFSGYPNEVYDKFKENKFNNILVNKKSLFLNNLKSEEDENYDLNKYSENEYLKMIMFLNGYDNLKNDNYHMNNNNKSTEINEKFKVIKEYQANMNDKLIIKADEDETSKAKLLGKNDKIEVIRLRDGIEYFNEKNLTDKIKTIGAEKEGYSLVGWKVNKDLQTGSEEDKVLTTDELIAQVIAPMNTLLTELNKSQNNAEYANKIKDNLILSEVDSLKNFHRFENGLEIVARWSDEVPVEKISVTFNANGGKIGSTETKIVEIEKNSKVSKVENPKKEGYDFKGWTETKDGDDIFDFELPIVENKTLYAKWEKIKENPTDPVKPVDPKEPEDKPLKKKRKKTEEVIENKTEIKLNKKDHLAYLKGYEDKTIRAEGNLSREEASMVFYRLLDKNYRAKIETKEHNFKDIENGRWSEEAIATLSKAGMIKGYEDENFKPEEKITRAEISAMISKLTETKAMDTKFKDTVEHWAEEYINSAQKQGWINGYEDGSFRPDDKIKRSEFAKIINTLLEREVEKENILKGIKDFKDLFGEEWYYTEIVEATNGHKYEMKDNKEIWLELDNREFK